jgi:hypothetical protein
MPGALFAAALPATAEAAVFHLRPGSAFTFSAFDNRTRLSPAFDASASPFWNPTRAGAIRPAAHRFVWSASRAFDDFAARGRSYAQLARHVHVQRLRLLGINGTTPFPMAAFEIGSKNLFLGNRLAINADAFRYRYGGYRLTLPGGRGFNGIAAVLPSLGTSSRTTGAELEAAYELTSQDFAGLNASYAHARRSTLPTSAEAIGQVTNVNSLQIVPSFEHVQPLSHGRSLTFDAAAIYRSSVRVANQAIGTASLGTSVRRSETTRFEASLTYRSSARLSVTAFIRNITDVRPDVATTLTTRNVANPATVSAVLSEPRTFGVSLRARL